MVATTTTGADGSYSFSLTPGAYTIREVCPAGEGWRQSQPGPVTSADGCGNNTYSINLGSGESDTNNDFFGNFRNFHEVGGSSSTTTTPTASGTPAMRA